MRLEWGEIRQYTNSSQVFKKISHLFQIRYLNFKPISLRQDGIGTQKNPTHCDS